MTVLHSVWGSRAYLLSTTSHLAMFWHRMSWLAWGGDTPA